MQEVSRALDEVKDLYQKVLGAPAPEIDPDSYVAFPPGVDPLNHAIQEVHQLKQLSEQMAFAPGPVSWVPRADSFATADAYVIRMEIPGVSREDLKIHLAGGECVVTGKRKPPERLVELHPLTLERPWGPFERRFTLPPGSHPDKVTAKYQDGVLELRVVVEGMRSPKEMKIDVA